MTPYADFTYFCLIGALLLPLMWAGHRGRADGKWVLAATVLMLAVQYSNRIALNAHNHWPEWGPLLLFGLYEWGLLKLALAKKVPGGSLLTVPLALIPLMVAKWVPLMAPDSKFGFAGISYVTFRALDVLWAVTDGALKEVAFLDFAVFLFFFPTISAGPIDRFRRFKTEWRRRRTKEEFYDDFDASIPPLFRGLLYKFVLATIIERYWLESARVAPGISGAVEYAYIYSLYLFFDFAGYSAFAVAVSRWFGIKTPENFNRPWAAQNIRDFWNRWHMSLSFWFRDHVYTRFLLTSVRRKWFKKRETASNLGYFVSFGLMGLWHGTAAFYLLYGFYHAVLMSGYDLFTRWKKKRANLFRGRVWTWAAHLLTVHAVVFGLWLFSGQAWQGRIPAGELLKYAVQQSKIEWRGYRHDPRPAPTDDRVCVAFTLGGMMADSYLAMEAADTTGFKNLQADILKYAAALGLNGKLDDPVHTLVGMTNLPTWDSARGQMVVNLTIVQKQLREQGQPDLALLVDLGMWTRLLEITSSVLADYPSIKIKLGAVGSRRVLDELHEEYEKLSPGMREHDPVAPLGTVLKDLQTIWAEQSPSQALVETTRDKLRAINTQLCIAAPGVSAAPSTTPNQAPPK